MNRSPEISIIIPVYNCEAYIAKCLDSLISQTLKEIEMICVNDGSTDKSLDLLEQYSQKDGRIKVFSQENSGPAAARNTALNNASGRMIMFCDSDDWYEPNMCEEMLKAVDENNVDIAICHSFFEFENPDESESERAFRGISDRYYNHPREGIYELTPKHIADLNVLMWNKIFRKDLIDKYGIRFPDGCDHEDDAFIIIYCFFASNIFYLNKKLHHYLVRKNSIMDLYCRKIPKNKYDRINISNFICDFFDSRGVLRNHFNDLLNIYQGQLSQCFDFFNSDEMIEIVRSVSEKLNKFNIKPVVFIMSDTNDIQIISSSSDIRKIRRRYWKYRILKSIDFFTKRDRNLKKYLKYKSYMEQIRAKKL